MIAAIRRSLGAVLEIVRRALPWDDERISDHRWRDLSRRDDGRSLKERPR